MMTRSNWVFSILSLLILDFSSGMVVDHLSSMKILVSESTSIASPITVKSSVSNCHLVIFRIGMPETMDRTLSAICSELISRENNATLFFWSTAIFLRIFNANAVLPIEGRAARMTSSAGLNQPSISSNP